MALSMTCSLMTLHAVGTYWPMEIYSDYMVKYLVYNIIQYTKLGAVRELRDWQGIDC